MDTTAIILFSIIALAAIFAFRTYRKLNRPSTSLLDVGNPLPDFSAITEDGSKVNSKDLLGTPTVMLFVRGNWCPFCSAQVEVLSSHYKDIIDKGARLILVTPKPLQTTRRVAQFFDFDFDYWLDEDLEAVRALKLVQSGGVPEDHRAEYGVDTVWPTAIVIDAGGTIRFKAQSKVLADRPNPKTLARELQKIIAH